MANMLAAIRRSLTPSPTEQRYTVDDYANWMQQFWYQGNVYQGYSTTMNDPPGERIDGSFEGRVRGAYASNGVVFACQVARMLVFTEARFAFQRMVKGRPGDLYGGVEALSVLERPWPNAHTGDLLSRMLQDVDLAGNFYGRVTTRDSIATSSSDAPGGPQIERLRPDYVVILIGRHPALVTDTILGYHYYPDGIGGREKPLFLSTDEVVHWAPIPDPLAEYRGMSWLTPVLRELNADNAAQTHKLRYFEKGATPNVIISYDPQFTLDQFERMKAMIDSDNTGINNAYRIMHLAGGADATVVGSNMQQIDFKEISGHGETRICAAARVPPVIVGLSEGLSAATYSNYGQARRHFADSWARPYWRGSAGALSSVIDVPARTRLWYDTRDISFLQEDEADAANIQSVRAGTVSSLISAGFTPESAVLAVENDDFTLLEHTGLVSVQLLPPGATTDDGGSSDAPDDDGGSDDDAGEDDTEPEAEPSSNGSASNGRSTWTPVS